MEARIGVSNVLELGKSHRRRGRFRICETKQKNNFSGEYQAEGEMASIDGIFLSVVNQTFPF